MIGVPHPDTPQPWAYCAACDLFPMDGRVGSVCPGCGQPAMGVAIVGPKDPDALEALAVDLARQLHQVSRDWRRAEGTLAAVMRDRQVH